MDFALFLTLYLTSLIGVCKVPKIVDKPKSRNQTQRESDERRGVKPIGFKVPVEFAQRLDELAQSTGLTKNIIIMQAVELWAKQQGK